jgi:hypothetical protein
VAWRIHVEADDVLDLLGESKVIRELQTAHPIRLEAMSIRDALDRPQEDPDGLRHGAAGPVGDLTGWFGTGQGEHLGDSAGEVGWLIAQQAVDTFFSEAPHAHPIRNQHVIMK